MGMGMRRYRYTLSIEFKVLTDDQAVDMAHLIKGAVVKTKGLSWLAREILTQKSEGSGKRRIVYDR